jgi:predicted secreted Zn-dependent protease
MTTKPTIQIGDEVREMTDEEIAQYEKDQAEFARQAQADADRQALRTATLAKLGLTADEVAALLS